MKFQIIWSEKKQTSTGKNKMEANLKDESGNVTDKVSIWGDFPNFATLMTGNYVDGELKPSKDPKYGPSLSPIKTYSQWKEKPNMTQIVEQKNENIKEAQGRKEEAIIRAGAQRDAVLIVTTFYANGEFPLSDGEIKEKVDTWMKYFLNKAEQPFQ